MTGYPDLFAAIYGNESHPAEDAPEENYPTSPGAIPLSQAGSLFLITSYMFSSVLFGAKTPQPNLSIFPDHAKLVKHFIGLTGPDYIGSEEPGVIDAVLAIGLYLEHSNNFVSGPLEDEDFLQYLQMLSLLSANTSSSTLRYAAHALTSHVLHAHPVDRLRLTFISDTLEHCPYESLKGSAVSWFKEEIMTAHERQTKNVFSSSVALTAAQPYLFPDTSALDETDGPELTQELRQSFPFHMAVLNFLYFISGKQYAHIVPSSMMTVVEEIYLGPLRNSQERLLKGLSGVVSEKLDQDVEVVKTEMLLLGERIAMASSQIDDS